MCQVDHVEVDAEAVHRRFGRHGAPVDFLMCCPQSCFSRPRSPLSDSYCVTGSPIKMIFRGHDAWRHQPFFQGLWKDPFPGFKKAVVIYAVYLGAEYAYKAATAPAIKHH